MQKDYNTVKNAANALFEEKKSKFIAYVKPVETEEEAVSFIEEIKSKHWDATHNVYAYDIHGAGGETVAQRYSDDGEPQGTAGVPVMEVIKKMNLQNLVVVVTRYFGGTMLGAGGLIRAYGKSASLGIEAACVVRKVSCRDIAVKTDYNLSGKIQNAIISSGTCMKNIEYTEDVRFIVTVPENEIDGFVKMIVDASFDRAGIEVLEPYFALFEVK